MPCFAIRDTDLDRISGLVQLKVRLALLLGALRAKYKFPAVEPARAGRLRKDVSLLVSGAETERH